MNGNCSVQCRPSVIKWVGKELTPDVITSKTDDLDFSQQPRPANIGKISDSDKSTENQQACVNDESLFLESTNSERKYSCTICKKRFKWRSHWKSHERIHTGERPFQCEICGKLFTRSDGLQCHRKVHIKIEKPKVCSPGTQPNRFLGNNVVEGVTGLKQDKVFICAYCGRTFGSLRGYCRHTDMKHKGLKSV